LRCKGSGRREVAHGESLLLAIDCLTSRVECFLCALSDLNVGLVRGLARSLGWCLLGLRGLRWRGLVGWRWGRRRFLRLRGGRRWSLHGSLRAFLPTGGRARHACREEGGCEEGKDDAHIGTVSQIRVNHMSTTDLPSRIARRS